MTAIDPVCGMPVDERTGVSSQHGDEHVWFCTEFCRQQFLRHPGAYEAGRTLAMAKGLEWSARRVAYFSMEVALDSAMPTYSGGLGVLAGDTLRSLADLELPAVAVSLVHHKGYFRQVIREGRQVECDASWEPGEQLNSLESTAVVAVEGREVRLGAWRYDVVGSSGFVVPLILLDSDLAANATEDRHLTDHLYGGDARYRLIQEVVLGIGGVRMLQALGCSGLTTYHLNEGHAALAPLELLRQREADSRGPWDFAAIRNRTVFTTHTPVAAGHDRFDRSLVDDVLGEGVPADVLDMLGGANQFNMTSLALNLSHYVNGVAMRHREVSSDMFPGYEIHQITNGVHSRSWTCDAFKALFDRHIPGWREDPLMLRNATALPASEIWAAHRRARRELDARVAEKTGQRLREDAFTIGFARRATAYKRMQLILSDTARLRTIAGKHPLQIVFAGKAHPADSPGKQSIELVTRVASELDGVLPIVFIENYDLDLALSLVAGVDLWLNTPRAPLEASGTSGMKAAHNGVPSLSVLDGWWREGHIEGTTGWSIGTVDQQSDGQDARDLYDKLERVILPLYSDDREGWIRVMQRCIALNASFFNTHRMVNQYLHHAYEVSRTSHD